MPRSNQFQSSQKIHTAATILVIMTIVAVPFQTAFALITGGEGNSPIHDPGWPKGAEAVFNNPARIAYWRGPMFGQWHAECRGDAKALNAVLADFAKLDVKTKRVIVRDGDKYSIWLNAKNDQAKRAAAKVDWIFMVWEPTGWESFRKLPVELNPMKTGDAEKGPPAEIEVYTGGAIRWADVTVPKDVELIDERLEAHGFTTADGIVLEGKVIDIVTKQPIAARILLQRIETGPKGERNYTLASETVADAQGRWVLKNAPKGWHHVVAKANGYVPKDVGNVQYDQPGWHFYDGGLSRPATVSGRVIDETGTPLAEVNVSLGSVDLSTKTDGDGLFHFDQVPVGNATIRLSKSGYCRPGLGLPIIAPAKDIELKMIKSAQVQVTVDFGGRNRPGEYSVEIKPEGGSVVGSWGGSGNIDAKNQISFNDVPPGMYVLSGRPNPSMGEQTTGPLTIELKGGETREITLLVK